MISFVHDKFFFLHPSWTLSNKDICIYPWKRDRFIEQDAHKNADRFMGFADVYDRVRPKCPDRVKEISLTYLGKSIPSGECFICFRVFRQHRIGKQFRGHCYMFSILRVMRSFADYSLWLCHNE